ncbi:MAG: PilZ domain-containing protein [Desulfovibrionaceae bacterium]
MKKKEDMTPEEEIQHRRAYRVEPPRSIAIKNLENAQVYFLKDISFLGLAFNTKKVNDFWIGQKIKIDVLLKEYIFISKMEAEVVRIIEESSLIACEFKDNTEDMEYRLSKLVLEIQKEYIKRKKRE